MPTSATPIASPTASRPAGYKLPRPQTPSQLRRRSWSACSQHREQRSTQRCAKRGEPELGDLSDVRVHTGPQAAASARAVGAAAYTVGRHVTFAAGRCAQTPTGKRLLAHELAHVVQQRDARAPPVLRRQTVGRWAAAPNAFHGIQLYYLVPTVPHTDRTPQPLRRGPYLIAPQLVVGPGGIESVAYYIAFRVQPGVIGPTNWNEYVIGPDSIDRFLANIDTYASQGAAAYMFGPPTAAQAGSARWLAGTGTYGEALSAAVRDPGWWMQMILGSAGALAGPAAEAGAIAETAETGAAEVGSTGAPAAAPATAREQPPKPPGVQVTLKLPAHKSGPDSVARYRTYLPVLVHDPTYVRTITAQARRWDSYIRRSIARAAVADAEALDAWARRTVVGESRETA